MKYHIEKHGTYLIEHRPWYQVWIDSAVRALTFYDKAEAVALAERLDAQVVGLPVLN